MLPPQSGDGNLTSVAPTTAQDGGHPPGTLVPIGGMYPHPGALSWPGAAPPRPTFLTSGPDPVTLLHSLRRRWLLAFVSGVVALTARLLHMLGQHAARQLDVAPIGRMTGVGERKPRRALVDLEHAIEGLARLLHTLFGELAHVGRNFERLHRIHVRPRSVVMVRPR